MRTKNFAGIALAAFTTTVTPAFASSNDKGGQEAEVKVSGNRNQVIVQSPNASNNSESGHGDITNSPQGGSVEQEVYGGNSTIEQGAVKVESNPHASVEQEVEANAIIEEGAVRVTNESEVKQANTNTSNSSGNNTNITNAGDEVGQNVNVAGDNFNWKSGAITGAPMLGSLYVNDRCQSGWGVSAGGGTPFNGSGGIGFQKVNKDDDCIEADRNLQKFLQAAAQAHVERLAIINLGGTIVLRGMDEYCESQDIKTRTITKAEHDEYCHKPIEWAQSVLSDAWENSKRTTPAISYTLSTTYKAEEAAPNTP